jgi:hypothetical protein
MLLQSGCTFFSRLGLHTRRDKKTCGMSANTIRSTLYNPVVTSGTSRFDVEEFYVMATGAFTVCFVWISEQIALTDMSSINDP